LKARLVPTFERPFNGDISEGQLRARARRVEYFPDSSCAWSLDCYGDVPVVVQNRGRRLSDTRPDVGELRPEIFLEDKNVLEMVVLSLVLASSRPRFRMRVRLRKGTVYIHIMSAIVSWDGYACSQASSK